VSEKYRVGEKTRAHRSMFARSPSMPSLSPAGRRLT
jgi:hypothetical protein